MVMLRYDCFVCVSPVHEPVMRRQEAYSSSFYEARRTFKVYLIKIATITKMMAVIITATNITAGPFRLVSTVCKKVDNITGVRSKQRMLLSRGKSVDEE